MFCSAVWCCVMCVCDGLWCRRVCLFGVGNPDLGNPAMDEGKDGEGEAARGGTGLVRVVR